MQTSAAGTGRGRNCLIESYLRPGHYLATVTATGPSRGHAAVRLIRQSPRPGPVLTNDGQAFFAVPADEMVQQRIVIAAGGRMRLETHAPGATLACRFEDLDGWPLVPVPGPCRLDTKLARGRYLWTQFPLTVASRRQTRLTRVSDPVVLKGPRPHTIAFNTWYDVQLDEGGKDRFLFDLEVDLDVQIELTNLMQGRLLRVEADGKTLIPVAAVAAQPKRHDETDEVAQEEEEGPNTAEQSSDEAGDEAGIEAGDEGGDEGNADEQGAHEGQTRRKERPAQVAARRSPPVATIHLPAGHYQLVTEHLHGSSEIAYRLFVGSDDLAPGMSKLIAVPFRARLHVPRSRACLPPFGDDIDVVAAPWEGHRRCTRVQSSWPCLRRNHDPAAGTTPAGCGPSAARWRCSPRNLHGSSFVAVVLAGALALVYLVSLRGRWRTTIAPRWRSLLLLAAATVAACLVVPNPLGRFQVAVDTMVSRYQRSLRMAAAGAFGLARSSGRLAGRDGTVVRARPPPIEAARTGRVGGGDLAGVSSRSLPAHPGSGGRAHRLSPPGGSPVFTHLAGSELEAYRPGSRRLSGGHAAGRVRPGIAGVGQQERLARGNGTPAG